MKKLMLCCFLIAVQVLIESSITAQTDSVAQPAARSTALDLAPAGIKAQIQVPQGVTLKDEGGTVLTNEKDFAIRIEQVSPDTFKLASFVNDDEMHKVKRYFSNTPETLFYEIFVSKRIEFHFHTLLKINDKYYHFYNDRGYPRYSQEAAELMFEAVRAIHP